MTQPFTDANGFVWHNGGVETDDHLAFGGHETHLIEIARSLMPEHGVVIDIGAHVGLYTINLAVKAREIYAIEANPKTYDVLLENIKANALQVPDCTIRAINLAAWDRVAYLDLKDENDKETGGSTRCIEPKHHLMYAMTGQTQAAPLDFALPNDCIPDLVKIDIEGAEAKALRGMQQIITLHKPVLFIEMHDIVYDDPQIREDVLAFLKNAGYEWNDDLTYGEKCYYVIAKHPNREEPEPEWEPEVIHMSEEIEK